MLILMSQRFKKSDSEAKNYCTNVHYHKSCEKVSISIYCKIRRERRFS